MLILSISKPKYVALKLINSLLCCQLAQLTKSISLSQLARVYKTKNHSFLVFRLVPTMPIIDNTHKEQLTAQGISFEERGLFTLTIKEDDLKRYKESRNE